MGTKINIAGLNKADVLAALYNRAQPQGLGFLHYDPTPMTPEAAQTVIDERGDDRQAMFGKTNSNGQRELYFDYLKGRVMKVNLAGDEFDPWLYDRDNGDGAAESALQTLKATQ